MTVSVFLWILIFLFVISQSFVCFFAFLPFLWPWEDRGEEGMIPRKNITEEKVEYEGMPQEMVRIILTRSGFLV